MTIKISKQLDRIESALTHVVTKDEFYAEISRLDSRLEKVETRLDSLEARLDSLEARLDSLEARLDSLEARIETLEKRYDSLEKITKKTFVKMLSTSDDISKIDTIEKQITRLNVDVNQYKDLLVNITSNYSNTIPFIEKRLDSIDNKVNRFEKEMATWRIYFNRERP